MKYLKNFNESVSSNSELEKKLVTIIDSINETDGWPPSDQSNFKEINSKKRLFGIKLEKILFEKCENKLNKLCYDLSAIIGGKTNKKISMDYDKIYDIQVTYDNRGIVIMSGLLTDNPKVLEIFHKDVNNDNIKFKIVEKVLKNVIKFSKIDLTSEPVPRQVSNQIPGTGCLRCGGEGCIKCVTDYNRPWWDKIFHGNNWVTRH